MSNLTNLLTFASLVVFYSTMFGAAYQMTIEPGEVLAPLSRWIQSHTRSSFLKKLFSCGKCVGGWLALGSGWIWFLEFTWYQAAFATCLCSVTTIVFTGLISVYVSNRV